MQSCCNESVRMVSPNSLVIRQAEIPSRAASSSDCLLTIATISWTNRGVTATANTQPFASKLHDADKCCVTVQAAADGGQPAAQTPGREGHQARLEMQLRQCRVSVAHARTYAWLHVISAQAPSTRHYCCSQSLSAVCSPAIPLFIAASLCQPRLSYIAIAIDVYRYCNSIRSRHTCLHV